MIKGFLPLKEGEGKREGRGEREEKRKGRARRSEGARGSCSIDPPFLLHFSSPSLSSSLSLYQAVVAP